MADRAGELLGDLRWRARSIVLGSLVCQLALGFGYVYGPKLRVVSVDRSGNGPTVSGGVTFRTAHEGDDTPPVISEDPPPEAAYLSNDLVIILWETDERATSFVRYGPDSVLEEAVGLEVLL